MKGGNLMNENKYILSDADIMELSEGCPMTEGGTLDEFVEEAAVVSQAVALAGVDLKAPSQLPGAVPYAGVLFPGYSPGRRVLQRGTASHRRTG